MLLTKESKRLVLIFFFYFFVAWSLTGVYFVTHSNQIPEQFDAWHAQIRAGTAESSTQFRLLSFWLADGVHRYIGQPVYMSYLSVRFVMTVLLLCFFHLFLLKWFRHAIAMLGTVVLAVVQPLTFLPFLQESDMVLFPFFLLGLWAIRERKFWVLAATLAVGCLAKESIALLIPLYVLVEWQAPLWAPWRIAWRRIIRIVTRTIGLSTMWALAFYATRTLFYEGNNSWLWQLPKNFIYWNLGIHYNAIVSIYLFFIPVLGMLWILPFMRQRHKPWFLQRVAPYIIIYFVLTALMGWPHETRLLVPLALVVIPSSLAALFTEEVKKEAAPIGTTSG